MSVDKNLWEFSCPEGQWTGRLDHREWSKKLNLVLYWSNI